MSEPPDPSHPAQTPRADRPRKAPNVLWLGCALLVFLFLLLVVGIMMFRMVRRPVRGNRAEAAMLPPDWRRTLRSAAETPPEAAQFTPPRADSGNAAEALFGHEVGRYYSATVRRLERGLALDSGDTARLRAARRDTSLDAVARAARMQRYSVVPLLLADTGARAAIRALEITIPIVFPKRTIVAALDAMLVRAYARAQAGELAAARDDLRAVVGLGLMIRDREPTWFGSRNGLGAVAAAARMLARFADRRDTASSAAATRLAAWAEASRDAQSGVWRALYAQPDSQLAALADTTLPFSARAEILYTGMIGDALRSPWRVFWGPRAAVWRRVHAFEQSTDPDLAALATAADSVLSRIGRVGRFKRLRLIVRER